MNELRCRVAVGLALALLCAPVLAHDDDPKILAKQPVYPGAGFRAALASDPGGSQAATAFGPPGGPVFVSPVPFTANEMTLMSWLPIPEFGSEMSSGADCWGYVSPSGREYGIIGLSHGTGFVEVTQPDNAQIVAVLPGPSSLWKDIKTYQHYAYSVSEGGDGIQVFDLSDIDNGNVTFVQNVTEGGATQATHNVAIDETSGRLYRTGGGEHGLRIYDLTADASDPDYIGFWADRYIHDAQIVTYTSGPNAGKQIAFCCSGLNGGVDDPGIDILDVTNPGAIIELARYFYQGASYSHQAWLGTDGTLLYVNDEFDEFGGADTTTYVIDVTDLTQPFLTSTFDNNNPAVGHNLYVRDDDLLFEANYRSGVRVFDLDVSATNPPEVAWFDTYTQDDLDEFNGLWNVYPYLPSGTILGSDLEKGLFVWHLGEPRVRFTDMTAVPQALSAQGGSWTVRIEEDQPGDLMAGSARLHVDTGAGWESHDLQSLGGDDYAAVLPPLPCGLVTSFYVSAQSVDGTTWTSPSVAGGDVHRAPVTNVFSVPIAYDMEGSDQGWISGAAFDDATTGLWERGDPRGTDAQPALDHGDGLDEECWFTGQGTMGGSVGENDVDDGTTTLLSPILDLSGLSEPRISFWLWYVNSVSINGAQPSDVFTIDLSDNGGATWTNVEVVAPTVKAAPGDWVNHEFRVADFLMPTNSMRVRFVASDLGDGSIVEAAIDDFEVFELGCRDCNGDGVSNAMAILSGMSADGNNNGIPDDCDGFGPLMRPLPGGPANPGGQTVPTLPGPGAAPNVPKLP